MLSFIELHPLFLEGEPASENARPLLLMPGSWLHRKAMKDIVLAARTLRSCAIQHFQVHLSPRHKAMPSTKLSWGSGQ